MMRVVYDPRTFTVGDELTGDGDDVPRVQRHSGSEVDVVDDIQLQTVLCDDGERFVKRVGVTADEIPRLSGDRSRDDDVSDKTIGCRSFDVDVGVVVEKRAWADRKHIAGAIARAASHV